MPLSWVVHCVDNPGKQGMRLGLMHPLELATSHSLTAGMVLLTDVGMFMVNNLGKSMGEVSDLHLPMVTELLTLSQTLSLSPPPCWIRVYPFPAHAEMQNQPPVHPNINL